MEKQLVPSDVTEIACDGGKPPYDHPLVYLKIDEATAQIECPYCSKIFSHKT